MKSLPGCVAWSRLRQRSLRSLRESHSNDTSIDFDARPAGDGQRQGHDAAERSARQFGVEPDARAAVARADAGDDERAAAQLGVDIARFDTGHAELDDD